MAFLYHHNQEAAEGLVDELKSIGVDVRAIQADVVEHRTPRESRRPTCWPIGNSSTSWSTPLA